MLPCIVPAALVLVFLSPEHPFIMGTLFRGNALNLAAAVAVYTFVCLILCGIWFLRTLKSNPDALATAKFAMMLKLCQIPAYAVSLALGVLCLITLFTIPFSLALLLFGYLSLVMSGMATIAAVILAARQRDLPRTQCAWIIAAQFIFCADVAASVLLFRTLKKNHPSSPKEVNP